MERWKALRAAVERARKNEIIGPDKSKRFALIRREDWDKVCTALEALQDDKFTQEKLI